MPLTPSQRLAHLEIPAGRIPVLLDTDIANEVDDPFAIAHAILSPDRIDLKAITIAPFRREGVSVPETIALSRGMGEKLLELLGSKVPLVDGASRWMTSEADVVDSPAVEKIIEVADSVPHLYLLSIGAATNVASALNKRPDLRDKITVLWLGGHAPEYRSAGEYNLVGDIHSSHVLLNCGVPLILFPALGVTSHLFVSAAGLRQDLGSANPVGHYLARLIEDYVPDHFGYEKELWDVATTAYLINPGWLPSLLGPTPGVSTDLLWTARPEAPLYRRVIFADRNAILGDLFRKVRDFKPA